MASSPALTPEVLLRFAYQAFHYYCGGLNAEYMLATKRGEAPWRIVRYERAIDVLESLLPLPVHQFVQPKTLEVHFQYLKAKCRVMPLGNLLDDISRQREVPPWTVSLTFDGGWKDHFERVFPLLKKYSLPATFFIPTAFIGTSDWFWTDKILGAALVLGANGHALHKLPFVEKYFPGMNEPDASAVHFATEFGAALVNRLRYEEPQERLEVLRILGREADAYGGLPSERLFLTWEEVQEMREAGMDFGTQGHSHRPVPEMSAEDFELDLVTSMRHFKEHGAEPLAAFAPPDGELPPDALPILAKYGFRYSLASGEIFDPVVSEVTGNELLGRVPIFQESVPNRIAFACRVWQTRSAKYRW